MKTYTIIDLTVETFHVQRPSYGPENGTLIQIITKECVNVMTPPGKVVRIIIQKNHVARAITKGLALSGEAQVVTLWPGNWLPAALHEDPRIGDKIFNGIRGFAECKKHPADMPLIRLPIRDIAMLHRIEESFESLEKR